GSIRTNRGLRALTVTQFLGAFNDNLFKQIMLFLAARFLFPGEDQQGLASAVFALPFILFSGIAGELSERYSKRTVIVAMKVAEVLVMIAAMVAFWVGSWTFLLVVLFVMGTQSAFFGPSKYGIIPELVDREQLMAANGIISMTTFFAILTGTAVAGPIMDQVPDKLWIGGAACLLIALVGTWTATSVTRTPVTRPDLKIGLNPFSGLPASIREMRKDGHMLEVVLANSFFFFNGGVLQQAVTGMGTDQVLGLAMNENRYLSYLLATLATSLMIGCLVVPIVGKRVSAPRLVTIGVSSMVLFQVLLTLVGPVVPRESGGYLLAHLLLGATGFFAAFFVVPIVSFVQDAPEEGKKGKTFAVNNFFNFIFIFLAGGFYLATSELEMPSTFSTALAALIFGAYLIHIRKTVGQLRLGNGPTAS
ncbi:MAG: MFS transporter, partial [Planctomycetota bacterium]